MKVSLGRAWASAAAAIVVGFGAVPQIIRGENSTDATRRLAIRKFGLDFMHESMATHFGLGWASGPFRRSSLYRQLERKVSRLMIKTSNAAAEADKLWQDFLAHPNSSSAAFAWAYASVLADRAESKRGSAYGHYANYYQRLPMLWLVASLDPGGDYDYARVRFLADCSRSGRPDLIGLGRRLLLVAPEDPLLVRALAMQLGDQRSEASTKAALSLCLSYLKAHPTDLSFINLVVFTYETRWLAFGQRREDGEKVIEWARKYIALAPKGCPTDADQENRIRVISKRLAEQKGSH